MAVEAVVTASGRNNLVSKTYSRAVMTASGTDRFSINNRLEVLYLVCITWMVRGTVTANSKRL